MAQAFSTKNYFKKIYAPDLLVELYKRHDIMAIFEITEQTTRKNVIAILNDFYNSLPPEQKIDIQREFAPLSSISTPHASDLFSSLFIERKVAKHETHIECSSDHDRVLYYYLFHKDLYDEVQFLHTFYVKPNYMLYEAKEVDLTEANLKITELTKEFTRLANKEDRVTECLVESKTLNGVLYVDATFEGAPELTTERDSETGNLDKTATKKKVEKVRIVYLPQDKEILISYTGSKYEKLIFLDTFLRIICNDGYTEKIESFDLAPFKDESFDFAKTNRGTPLLMWKIKAITFSFGSEKQKNKIRLTLPSSQQENGLHPLFTCLEELQMKGNFKHYTIENITLSMSFTDKNKADKAVNVPITVSLVKSSLCPLFFYHRYARTILKQAHIENGFVEAIKKEMDDVAKKWSRNEE
jgi:hypothetical protein